MGKCTPKNAAVDHDDLVDLINGVAMPSSSKYLALYLALSARAAPQRELTIRTITRETRLSRATVYRHLKSLEATGWITRTGQQGTGYAVQAPEWADAETEGQTRH